MSWGRGKRWSGRRICQHCPSRGSDPYVREKKKKSELHNLCIPTIIIITSSALLSHFNMLSLSHIPCFPLHVQWVAAVPCVLTGISRGLKMLWSLANKTKYTCWLSGWPVRIFPHFLTSTFLYYIALHAISSFYNTIVQQRSVCGRAHETHNPL